jgi:hypothetical protein
MRKTRRDIPKWKAIPIVLLFTCPFAFVGWYATTAFSLFHSIVEFTYETPPNPDEFITADFEKLAFMADYYDNRYEQFHIPLNFSTDTVFTNADCTEVWRYAYSDNGAQFTGLALTGWIFKYLTGIKEENQTLVDDATRVIRKLVSGMTMLMAVPNGGIGPDYPGILARGYADPQHRDIAEFYFLDNDNRHHNGTGVYSDWRWRAYTSNDEYSGFYSGLGLLLKYVDLPDVQNVTRLMIDQLAKYMIHTNFLGVDYHGGPTGVEQKPRFFIGGTWVCLLLKMAALVNPAKYEPYYRYYAVNQFYAWWSTEGGEQESVSNYYSYTFGYHIMFTLLVLETDPKLHGVYLDRFLGSLWRYTQNHRNPFFNVIYLLLTQELGNQAIIEADIEDILARWEIHHFPDRMLGYDSPTADYFIVDNFARINNFMATNPLAPIFRPLFMEVIDNHYYNKPLTPEFRNSNIFIWERNPYQYVEPVIWPNYEFTGSSFTVPYWMTRYFGLLTPAERR